MSSDKNATITLRQLSMPKLVVRKTSTKWKPSTRTMVTLTRLDNEEIFTTPALVDSGSTGTCINKKFVEEKGLEPKPLPIPVPAYNTDRSVNKSGTVTHYVELHMQIKDHSEIQRFYVMDLGPTNLFIGHNWLQTHTPDTSTSHIALKCVHTDLN